LSGLNSIEEQSTGLPIHRYRTILDPNNTPFSYEEISYRISYLYFLFRKSASALPAKRLWTYLVNEEQTQGIFIKYIFKRKMPTPSTPPMNKVNRGFFVFIEDKNKQFPFLKRLHSVKKPRLIRSLSLQPISVSLIDCTIAAQLRLSFDLIFKLYFHLVG